MLRLSRSLNSRWQVGGIALGLTACFFASGCINGVAGRNDSSRLRSSKPPSIAPSVSNSATVPTDCKASQDFPTEPVPANADSDGVHAAFIEAVDVKRRTVTYDVVQFLTGDAAVRAYQKDNPGEKGGPDNDYYIVNENSKLRTNTVAADACLVFFGSNDPNSSTPKPSLAAFADAIGSQKKEQLSAEMFWLTKKSGLIVSIRQQWFP